MPKRPRKSRSGSPRAVLLLAAMTLALFVSGELFIMLRTDSGRVFAARYLHIGDEARVTQLLGKQIRRALRLAGVPRDSVRETVEEGKRPALRWRVGLRPDASLLQVNYAITRVVTDAGGRVFSGHEKGDENQETVTLLLGFGGRRTHQVVLVRPKLTTAEERPGGRLAVVLYGFGDDPAQDQAYFQLPVPFAVALVAGAPGSTALFKSAHEHDRELILSLPLEPLNYPQVNPGPGTIEVTMSGAQITGLMRRYLDQAGPVSAVANYMGSLATQDMAVMTAIYEELKRERLPFLHVAAVPGAVCRSLAGKLGVPYDRPDEIIESETRPGRTAALDRRWTQVLKQAHRHRSMLVMIRATPTVRDWLPRALSAKRLGDVNLVSVSAVLKRPVAL